MMCQENICSSWVSCVILCIALIMVGPYAGTVQAGQGGGSRQIVVVGEGGESTPQNLRQTPVTKKLQLPQNKLLAAMPVAATKQASVALGFAASDTSFGDILITAGELVVSPSSLNQVSNYTIGDGTGTSSVTVTEVGTAFDLILSDVDGVIEYRGDAYSNNGQLALEGVFTDVFGVEAPFAYIVNDDGTIADINSGQIFSLITDQATYDLANEKGNGLPQPLLQFVAIPIIVLAVILAVCLIGAWFNWFKCDASGINGNDERGTLWRRINAINSMRKMQQVC